MSTPIIFAMDDNYAMPTSVAMYSILCNTKEKGIEFYILYNKSLSIKSKEMLKQAIKKSKGNASLKYIDVDGMLNGLKSTIEHISVATYYRILLPIVLTKYDSCLYLDGDIVVTGDIGELLNLQIPDHIYVAGVKTVMLQTARKKIQQRRMEQLNIDDISKYINAGVTLLNLKALRENYCVDKMIKLIPLNFPLQDQDIINKVCFGKISNLPAKYNVMPITLDCYSNRPSKVYTENELKDARLHPCIIHYADKYKPWKYEDVKMGKTWEQFYTKLYPKKELNREKISLNNKLLLYIKKISELLRGR